MTRPALVISDLHLPVAPSPFRDAFRAFLRGAAREASALYILGDLFEYWIGDDVGMDHYAEEISGITALAASGVPVYFQRGNRDFLVGRRFERATGARILPDPFRVLLGGVPTVLSHGDVFCTDDVRYQKWRRFARNPLVRWIFLRLPRARRERIADGMRNRSAEEIRAKTADIMDVNTDSIARAFRKHDVTRMIHGHTHRPADHLHVVDGRDCQRFVLCDWRPDRREALRIDETGVQRVPLA